MLQKRAQKSRRVLIIDDDRSTAEIFVQLLNAMGHEAACVLSALEAAEVAQAFRPDVALVDIAMPSIDGHTLARALRAMPDLKHVRVVAVSGHDAPADHVRSRQAGFDAHVGKPLDSEMLDAIIRQLDIGE